MSLFMTAPPPLFRRVRTSTRFPRFGSRQESFWRELELFFSIPDLGALSDSRKGLMVAVPVLGGLLLRLVIGPLATVGRTWKGTPFPLRAMERTR